MTKEMSSQLENQEVIYEGRNQIEDDEAEISSYVIRGLTEEEVPKWSEFCAQVFFPTNHHRRPPITSTDIIGTILNVTLPS
jgi:hypothetical protein